METVETRRVCIVFLTLKGRFSSRLPVGVCKCCKGGGLSREMRVLESGFEFEAIAQQTISTDVSSPDERNEECKTEVSPESERIEGQWQCVGVDNVVTQATDTRAREIPDHRKVQC